MSIIDASSLDVIERLAGWEGRFHSPSVTFAPYDFSCAAPIYERSHQQEEVYEVIEGELEITIDGRAQIVRPGLVAIVPRSVRHSVNLSLLGALLSSTTHEGPSSPNRCHQADYTSQ